MNIFILSSKKLFSSQFMPTTIILHILKKSVDIFSKQNS